MNKSWPKLSFEDAKDTYETLHLFTQVVGKIKVRQLPWINHSWHVTLSVTPFGLTTSSIAVENRYFEIDFNFIEHQLNILTDNGQKSRFSLEGISVATFYNNLLDALNRLGLPVNIYPIPNEIETVIPFNLDTVHATYKAEHVEALHKALLHSQEALTKFRSTFRGKNSPVHFFWGSFDLAVSRFSGREAPKHPGGVPNLPDWVAQEAYSHEVSSCGFWPGSEALPYAAFYSYIYPEPEGFSTALTKPEEAFYHPLLREFILPYQAVRQSENPQETLMNFLQSTYEAAADLAQWNRRELENKGGGGDHP